MKINNDQVNQGHATAAHIHYSQPNAQCFECEDSIVESDGVRCYGCDEPLCPSCCVEIFGALEIFCSECAALEKMRMDEFPSQWAEGADQAERSTSFRVGPWAYSRA